MINSDVVFETQFNPFRPNPWRREKMKLNFYFYDSFWCLERFYEGLKGTFEASQRKAKIKIFTKFLVQYNFQKCTGR